MAMSSALLSLDLQDAMGFPSPPTIELIGLADGIIAELIENGSTTFGNVPGPHLITGITAASMANKISGGAGFPSVSIDLLNMCSGIIKHITESGVVFYAGPPPAPPAIPPSAAYNSGGTISGLSGSAMANEVKTAMGKDSVSIKLLNKCTAIVNHIIINAEINSGVFT